jgi:hypothetical protein
MSEEVPEAAPPPDQSMSRTSMIAEWLRTTLLSDGPPVEENPASPEQDQAANATGAGDFRSFARWVVYTLTFCFLFISTFIVEHIQGERQ